MDKRVWELCQHRIEQAFESFGAAEIMVERNMAREAVSCAHHAVFYALRAILAAEGKGFGRHRDAIVYFNRTYVAGGKFPRELGRMLLELQQTKEKLDYDDLSTVSAEKAGRQVKAAEKVITEIVHYLG